MSGQEKEEREKANQKRYQSGGEIFVFCDYNRALLIPLVPGEGDALLSCKLKLITFAAPQFSGHWVSSDSSDILAEKLSFYSITLLQSSKAR